MMLEINKIYLGDCLEVMKSIEDKSIGLIIADPPYFKVMQKDHKGNKYEWDNQWESREDYIEWIKQVAKGIKRILKINGSFYIFADDKICAYIQVELDKIFNLENNIVWEKPNNMTIKGWNKYRCYSPVTERILFYSNENRNTNLENELYFENVQIFKPIIEYMIEQKRKIKKYFNFKTDKEFNEYVNKITNTSSVVSRHYFTYSQWVFPTEEIYKKLQTINNEVFKKEYEVFKKEYEVRRRYFNPKENYTDVWTSNIIGGEESNEHPTQKPIKIISRIIDTSSNESDLILDPFSGSGTTAIACHNLKRNFICIEKDPEYHKKSVERYEKHILQERMF